MSSQLNLILLGPPGAGKGTQAERLTDDFNLPYIATGDILRAAVRDETPLGREAKSYMDKGELVPDDVITAVILEALGSDEARDGFLLDGFPRTRRQADALDKGLEEADRRLTAVIVIDVPDEEVTRRLSGRRVSVKTGRVYHIEFDPPKHEGRCDIDGSRLVQRDDDKPETIAKRLAIYHRETEPLVEYYEERGLLRRFDGTRSPTEVHDHIRATIATLRLEDEL
ncbi:MAG TPA: adenylate kinase [Solirubrobacteraceae bacterium]|nr:adenylate kinase [Solirubrobacteraceae bacterium]